ncbi:hypothetical protein D3C80_1731530 [compost metagenome]
MLINQLMAGACEPQLVQASLHGVRQVSHLGHDGDTEPGLDEREVQQVRHKPLRT